MSVNTYMPVFKELSDGRYVAYDPKLGTYSVVAREAVPPLQPLRLGQVPPQSDQRRRELMSLLAMLDFQRRANGTGDPSCSKPYLDELAKLLKNPNAFKSIRLSWQASESKSGHIKAVGVGQHQGRVLYGDRAAAALRYQERLGNRERIPQPDAGRSQWREGNRRAHEILTAFANGEHTPEDLQELGGHLQYLPTDRLLRARSILRAEFKGLRGRDAQVRGLMDHIRVTLDAEDRKKAEAGEPGVMATHPLDNFFTDSLGYKRGELPQIPDAKKPQFLDELKQEGIGHEKLTVPALELKPTQKEFSPEGFAKLQEGLQGPEAESLKSNRITISADDYILDGHHRWLDARVKGESINVVKIDLPIKDLIKKATQFADHEGIARKTTETPLQPPEETPLDRLAANHENPEVVAEGANDLAMHDAINSAYRGEHGAEIKAAVERGGRWENHKGNLVAKHAAIGKELAALKAGPQLSKEQAKEVMKGIPAPAMLPDNPHLYFNVENADETIPVEKIKNVRARPEGIENAAKFMEGARLGKLPKRDPIKVVKNDDGTFTVADGNSTYANAVAHKWAALPVKFVDRAFLEAEQAKTKEKEHAKAAELLASKTLFYEHEHSLPKDLRHGHDTAESLMAAAKEAKPIFDEVLDTGKGVDKALGATSAHATSEEDYAKALDKPGPIVVIGGLKGMKRAKEKVDADYGGDWSKLHDVVRGTIGVESHTDIPKAIEAIRNELGAKGWSIAKQPKNKFETPTDAGYRDINLTFTTGEGLTGEIQVNTKAMLKAKKAAHGLYEQQRTIKAEIVGREPTHEEMEKYNALADQQKRIYDTAWHASLGLADDAELSSVLRHAQHPGAAAGAEQAPGADAAGRDVEAGGSGGLRDEGAPGEPAGVPGTDGRVDEGVPDEAKPKGPGFTGATTDSLGRTYHWVDGKRVKSAEEVKNALTGANNETGVPHGELDATGRTGGEGRLPGEQLGGAAPAGAGTVEPEAGGGAGSGVPGLPEGEGAPGSGDVQPVDGGGHRSGHGERVSPRRTPRKRRPAGGPPRDNEGRRLGGGVDGTEPAIPDPTPAEQVASEPPAPDNPTDLSAGNFRYTDRNFFAFGLKSKFNANMAAIRTLREIQADGRTTATPEEQAILSRFTGWGQFPGVFNDFWDTDWRKHLEETGVSREEFEEERGKWSKERDALHAILSTDEWNAAKKSTLNAHYTHPDVVDAHWKIAQKLGFKGGRYLETSAGIGYYLGLMPPDLAAKTRPSAVELDPTPGAMLGMLYPQADVKVQGFQEHLSPDGFYDLIASNVPFGDYGVHDPRYNKHQANIHDYFFLKSADKVRPGGLVMHITSTGTLDKADPKIRSELAKTCDLVGAIRFPGGAHKANAGTDVVTDMLILRKRLPGEAPGDQSWLETTTVPDPAGGEPIPVNKYFADHPEQMLGTLDRTGTMYGGKQKNVSITPDYEQKLQAAIDRLPADVMSSNRAPKQRFEPETLPAPGAVKIGGYHIQEGKLFVRESDSIVEQDLPSATVKRIGEHLGVRDAIRAVINAETAGQNADAARAELNAVYDAFVKKNGYLNEPKNKKAFASDPDSPPVLALEKYDPKTKKAAKADIFSKIVVGAIKPVEKVNNVSEGLGVSLHETGGLDVDRIAQLTGMHREAVGRELVEQGLAYEDPSEGWQPHDHYLSGNVRRKLALARSAAANDPRYTANVKALEAVQPEDIHHDDIDARLGSPWIPPSDIGAFVAKTLGASPMGFSVTYDPRTSEWHAEYEVNHHGKTAANSHAATKVWGTERANFINLLNSAMNSKMPMFTMEVPGSDPPQKVADKEANDAAAAKIQEIKNEFKDWVWTDEERRERLHRHYNDNYNNIRNIKYNGQHQQFPGMNPSIRSRLHPHIKDFAWQVVTTGKGLAGHEVGTGKTYAMISSAMELRRLGLARKPALLCKKANVEAITKDALDLYPGAKILSTADMFSAEKRKATISRIATGDYDMIIMTHDHMDMMGMKPETVQKYIEEELAEVTAAYEAAFAENGKGDRVVKNLEKQKANLEAKLNEAVSAETKDDAVYFEDTGIDQLFVDEAHRYKSLPCYTKMQGLKGVPNTRSDRATTMLMRTRWLADKNKGRGTVFLTGTPISNTMAELYNMQRFIQPQELKERGLDVFDAWANTFGDVETKHERTVTGEYKPVTRFSKFSNMPELMAISKQMLDVQRADDLKKPDGSPVVVRPKKNSVVVKSPKSAGITALMEGLRQRAADLKGQRPGPGADNMLSICTDGRKGSIDLRLIDSHAEDDPESKANRLIDNVVKIHGEGPGKTQMIFSDMGSNPMKNGFYLFGDMINKLVQGGIPREKIADFTKLEDKQREAAIQGLKDGSIAVALGGTDTLGTGVNAQEHLLALHHLDCPWRPSDLEQREGRAYRHGNLNKEIHIHNYVTEGSLDELLWQGISRKARFIKQVMHAKAGEVQRSYKEEDTEELSPEQIMAAASGDPRILEKVQLDEDVRQLQSGARRHEREQYNFKSLLKHADLRTADLQKAIEDYRATAKRLAGQPEFHLQTGGQTFTERGKARERFLASEGLTQKQFAELPEDTQKSLNGKYAANAHTWDPAAALEMAQSQAKDWQTHVGTYRGLPIHHKNGWAHLETLGGKQVNTGSSLRAIENKANAMGDLAEEHERTLAQHHKDMAAIREKAGKDYPRAAELKAKAERLKALEAEMAAPKPAEEPNPIRQRIEAMLEAGQRVPAPFLAEFPDLARIAAQQARHRYATIATGPR